MASNLQAVYFRAADGAEPVRDFIEGLDLKRRAALLRQLDRLNDLSDAMPISPSPTAPRWTGSCASCDATWARSITACFIAAPNA